MSDLQAQIRDDLTAALRAKDREAAKVLRTVLSAIANAEAQPVADQAPTSLLGEGAIAGAVAGVGAAEVARRALSEDDVRAVVAAERAERLGAAQEMESHGAAEPAGKLRAEAAMLDRYLH